MLFGATNQIRSYPDVILARFKPDGIHGNRRNRNVRLERAKGFGVAPGSQPISKKTGIIFHVLTANMTFAIWQERTHRFRMVVRIRGWSRRLVFRRAAALRAADLGLLFQVQTLPFRRTREEFAAAWRTEPMIDCFRSCCFFNR